MLHKHGQVHGLVHDLLLQYIVLGLYLPHWCNKAQAESLIQSFLELVAACFWLSVLAVIHKP